MVEFSNIYIQIYLISFVLKIVTKIYLDVDNYNYRKKNYNKIPEELKDHIDKEKLEKINKYTNEKFIFSTFTYFFDKIFSLLLILFCFYPYIFNNIIKFNNNSYISAIIFFAILSLIETIFSIPFSLYWNFVIEKKYEFNKMTFGIWLSDLIKELIISGIFGVLTLIPIIFILQNFPANWYLFIWGFLFLYSLIMQIIYPSLIAPLFNKFKPIENEELKKKIEEIFNKTGYNAENIYEMDASKRSSHSNAYFTGFGKSKRVVLFDTLINQMNIDEIASILLHEIGHYKKKHILKNIIIQNFLLFIGLIISFLFVNDINLYNGFGFKNIDYKNYIFIGLFILSLLSDNILFFTKPIFSNISRKNELEADNYTKEIYGTGEYLKSALIKLNIKNLSNLYPSNKYVWFYYSHPPLLERIKNLS